MTDLESIRAILHSKYIDPSNVKPYTGLRVNSGGKYKKVKNRCRKTNVKLIIDFQVM